jgi:hypothetical protein
MDVASEIVVTVTKDDLLGIFLVALPGIPGLGILYAWILGSLMGEPSWKDGWLLLPLIVLSLIGWALWTFAH